MPSVSMTARRALRAGLMMAVLLPVASAWAAPVRPTAGSLAGYRYFGNGNVGLTAPAVATNCTSKTVTWTLSGQTCSTTTGITANGATPNLSSTNGRIGTGRFTCDAPSDTYNFVSSGSDCSSATCTSQLLSWSPAGVACAANTGVTNNAQSKALPSTNGNDGTGNFTCNSSTNTYTYTAAGSSCTTPPPTACTDQVKSWTQGIATCSGRTGITNDAQSSPAPSTNGNTGTGNFTCSAASDAYTFVSTGSTCLKPQCTDQALSWTVGGVTCTASSGATNNGAAKALTATGTNQGNVNATCNSATDVYSLTSATCAAPAPAGCTTFF